MEKTAIRVIKFRGRRMHGSEWLYGDLNHINGQVFIFDRSEDAPLNSPDWFEVDPVTVGEYIGIADKVGIAIYEGDILSTISDKTHVIESYSRGVWKGTPKRTRLVKVENKVVCEWERYGFVFKTLHPSHHGINIPSFEVIGNIHDNPELLPKAA